MSHIDPAILDQHRRMARDMVEAERERDPLALNYQILRRAVVKGAKIGIKTKILAEVLHVTAVRISQVRSELGLADPRKRAARLKAVKPKVAAPPSVERAVSVPPDRMPRLRCPGRIGLVRPTLGG